GGGQRRRAVAGGRRAVHRQVVDPGRHRRRDAYCEGRAGPVGPAGSNGPVTPGGGLPRRKVPARGKFVRGVVVVPAPFPTARALDDRERRRRERQRVVRGNAGAAVCPQPTAAVTPAATARA